MGVASAHSLATVPKIKYESNELRPGAESSAGSHLAPLTLIAVMAKAIFLLPSMFVFKTRRMCWNFSGITKA